MPIRFQVGLLLVWVLMGPLLWAPTARAQELTLAQATELLAAPNADEVRMGIEAMGLLGNPAAVPLLSERIRRGLPPALLLSAVDTLAVLGRPEAGPILFDLLSHRRPEVRLRAVQAVASCAPRGADRALVHSLSDASPEVREAAAETLGVIGAVSALPELFLAFERDVAHAGPSLAALARVEDVPRILGFLGRMPLVALRPMMLTLLTRTDLAARVRMQVVGQLGELATPEVRSLLGEFVATLAPNDASPLRRAAEETMNRIAE